MTDNDFLRSNGISPEDVPASNWSESEALERWLNEREGRELAEQAAFDFKGAAIHWCERAQEATRERDSALLAVAVLAVAAIWGWLR